MPKPEDTFKVRRFEFPMQGLVRNVKTEEQPPNTTRDLRNVRPFDTGSVARGGSRVPLRLLADPGTSYGTGDGVQAIAEVLGVSVTGSGYNEATDQTHVIVYVINGVLYRLDFNVVTGAKNETTIGTVAGTTDEVRLVPYGPRVYIFDGTTVTYSSSSVQTAHIQYYDATDDTLNDWELGTWSLEDPLSPDYPGVPLVDPNEDFSVDGNDDDARTLVAAGTFKGFFPTHGPIRIGCKWGSRMVLTADGDLQNLYVSKLLDPDDFDYRPRMRDRYIAENLQIEQNNEDGQNAVDTYNDRLHRLIGPDPGDFVWTYTAYDGVNVITGYTLSDATWSTGTTINERVADSYCKSNSDAIAIGVANTTATYTPAISWVDPSVHMRDYSLEKKEYGEVTRGTYNLRLEEIEDDEFERAMVLRYSDLGLLDDDIVNLIPYTNNLLLIFCKGSIHELNGLDITDYKLRPVTRSIGGQPGNTWTISSDGDIFFVGSDGYIYMMRLQEPLQRIDDPIEDLLSPFYDSNDVTYALSWDEREEGMYLHAWDSSNSVSLWYDGNTRGWFRDTYPTSVGKANCAMPVHGFYTEASRRKRGMYRYSVWGSINNGIYYYAPDWSGTYGDEQIGGTYEDIASWFQFGPINSGDSYSPIRLYEFAAYLGNSEMAVWYAHYSAPYEDGDLTTPVIADVIYPGREQVYRSRLMGRHIFTKFEPESSDEPWEFEYAIYGYDVLPRQAGRGISRADWR